MMSTGDIRLGVNGLRIGDLRLDPTLIRGEGDRHDPRLVIPLIITMHPQPIERQIAIIHLTATLHSSQSPFPGNQLGAAATVDLLDNMPCRSIPSGPNDLHPELRFPLTDPQIQLLEKMRHAGADNRFSVYLYLRGVVVWLRHTGNSSSPSPTERSTLGEGGWEPNVGMFSELLPFWNTHFETLRVDIEPSVWVDKVLPGIGYDRVRLLEVQFSTMPRGGIYITQFDKARMKYDAGDYPGCIQDCRGIQNAWEKAMGATRNQVIAKALGAKLGWPENDWHTRMLDSIWKGYADMVNAAHHPEHTPEPLAPTAADARLCLMLTAILTEYLDQVSQKTRI